MNDENKIRVLLVDDETKYTDVLTKRMSKRNFVVSFANGGTKAIEILRAKDFDVAVLDLKMEDMNGIEILKIFKKMLPKMQIIMLTGYSDKATKEEILKSGAFAYLQKPCPFDILLDTIKKAARN